MFMYATRATLDVIAAAGMVYELPSWYRAIGIGANTYVIRVWLRSQRNRKWARERTG